MGYCTMRENMPPIPITKYTWSQNISEIHIRLPLRNVKPSKVNIITAEKFLKVNFAPYLFQLVLYDRVDPTKTKCILKDYEVVVELTKFIPQLWDLLSQTVNQKDLIELKKHIISQEHERIAHRSQIQLQEKQEHKNIVNTFQININKEEKDKIESMKNQVKLTGFQELTKLKSVGSVNSTTGTHNTDGAPLNLPVPVPLPRAKGVIQFNLSQRVLPSPKRASTRAEEEEWLKKEAEAMRISGFVPDDLTDEERNPTWLLEKGMKFFKNGNFLAAINAFSYGHSIAPKMPIFYLRLAQTQIKLQHYYKAVANCTKALELLEPVVEKNKAVRAETYRTRATAYQCVNASELSCQDYRAAEILD